MMSGQASTRHITTVREQLANDTREAHEALHVHPVSIGLLQGSDDVSLRAAINAAYVFTHAPEQQRQTLACWDVLNLRTSVSALASDATSRAPANDLLPSETLSEHALLGALYVAHGAQFGRQQIAATLRRNQIEPIPTYYAQTPDKCVWQQLLFELERCGATHANYQRIRSGAAAAFSAYHQAMDRAIPCKHRRARTRT